jgi:hypothetical protein
MAFALLLISSASMNCYHKSVYDYISACTIFGCFVGFCVSFEIETYYGKFGNQDLATALGRSVIYTLYASGTSACTSILIARFNCGYSAWYYVCAVLVPLITSAAIGASVYYPSLKYDPLIPLDGIRYLLSIGLSAVQLFACFVLFKPLRVEPPFEFEDDNIRFAKSLMTRAGIPSSSSDCSQ